jgi:hypothetical protein
MSDSLERWRLILGEAGQAGLGGSPLSADAMARDAAWTGSTGATRTSTGGMCAAVAAGTAAAAPRN